MAKAGPNKETIDSILGSSEDWRNAVDEQMKNCFGTGIPCSRATAYNWISLSVSDYRVTKNPLIAITDYSFLYWFNSSLFWGLMDTDSPSSSPLPSLPSSLFCRAFFLSSGHNNDADVTVW